MLIFIIISITIGCILLWVSLYTTMECDKPHFIFMTIFAAIYLLYSALYLAFSPANIDVRNGTAEYVKEHHIETFSNDTIEYDIYRLEWVNRR